jgi:glycosyltransferase involved in cell wall biosynthesis
MRILKTTQTYYPYLSKGGPPMKIRGIAAALARRGHEVTVLTADLGETDGASDANGWKRMNGEWGGEGDRDGVKAIYLAALANYRATTINRHLLSFCRRRLGEFDVVHVYGLYDLFGPVVAQFCRRRGVPYVVEPLGMFQPRVRSRQKKRLYHALMGGALLRGAAVIIATSETERVELIGGGIAAERIVLRRNGLDLGEFKSLPARGAFRATLGINKKEPLVLFIGRLSFIKGLDVLVQAFAEIARDARLVIAGPDDKDGCRERVASLVEELKLNGRVIIHGPLYGIEKHQALIDADLFVLPSRYESFGNAAAEAIACGTPVLVSDGCGIAPLLDGAALVVPCAIDGLRDAMNRFLAEDPLAACLRGACASVAQGLSWDAPVQTMEHIYSSLISTDGPAGAVTEHSQASS